MADVIAELVATPVAINKLGARGISPDEVQQMIGNRYVLLRNRSRSGVRSEVSSARRLLVGKTDGGRPLTLVLERTIEPTTWLIVTGWSATQTERKMLDRPFR